MNELALFAGAGGGILGGKLLGWRTICAVEWEPYPASVLLARQNDGMLPAFPIWDDVQTFDGKPWSGLVDVVSGGFPCQDISSAGRGAGIEGERSGMWKHMARIIGEVRPKYAFVENSPMLVGRGLATVLADLAEMGYDAKWGIVGAHHVSAPHRRDRIWVLAWDSNRFNESEIRRVCERETSNPCGICSAMADSNLCGCDDGGDSERQHEANHAQVGEVTEDQQSGSVGQHRTSKNGCNMADTDLSQRKRMRCPSGSEQEYADPMPLSAWWGQDPADTPKSNVGRVAHGVAARVDRLKAIGNGQVPLCAATAWRLLTQEL